MIAEDGAGPKDTGPDERVFFGVNSVDKPLKAFSTAAAASPPAFFARSFTPNSSSSNASMSLSEAPAISSTLSSGSISGGV